MEVKSEYRKSGFRIEKKTISKLEKSRNAERPIKYKFLNNCHKLEEQNISIAKDLTKGKLAQEKILRKHLKDEKKSANC